MMKYCIGLLALAFLGCDTRPALTPKEHYVAVCDGQRYEVASSGGYIYGSHGCVHFFDQVLEGPFRLRGVPKLVFTACGCNLVGRVREPEKPGEGGK